MTPSDPCTELDVRVACELNVLHISLMISANVDICSSQQNVKIMCRYGAAVGFECTMAENVEIWLGWQQKYVCSTQCHTLSGSRLLGRWLHGLLCQYFGAER